MARSFNGSSDLIDLGTPSALNLTSAITVSAWIFPTAIPAVGANYDIIAGKGYDGTNEQYILRISGQDLDGVTNLNSVQFLSFNGTNSAGAEQNNIVNTNGIWYHICGTVDSSGNWNMYVNGSNSGQSTLHSPRSPSSSTAKVAIGTEFLSGTPGRYFAGTIADVAIWNTNLSSSDVAKLAAGYRPIDVNSANLVGWWPLGGSGAKEPDDSGNNNPGTLTGTTIVGPPPAIQRGSRLFNGTSDFIDAGSGIAPTAITISCWVYPTSLANAYSTLVSRVESPAAAFWQLYVKSSGKLAQYIGANATVSYDGTGSHTLTTGTWYHLALVYDSTNGLVGYVNGSGDGTAGANGALQTTFTHNLTFSKDTNTAGRWLGGSLADVAIWNTNLSAANITSLANGVRPTNVNSANLQGWWPLDGFSNATEPDASGNGHTGTLTGTLPNLGPPPVWRLSNGA